MRQLPPPTQACVAAIARSHAGEILQGAVRDGGRTRRLLLSLPAPALWTKAELIDTPGEPLAVRPAWAHKTVRAARILLRRMNVPLPDMRVRLTTNIPVGKGCGSSTTDILATLRALLLFLNRSMTEEDIARLIVEVEQASDGSILSRPALFRHREGVVHEYLQGTFPDMGVIVIDTLPGGMVHTASMPRARYSREQLDIFEVLAGALRRAFREKDARAIGSVATASARISQGFLPKPHFETLLRTVVDNDGLGIAAAHSGTVLSALMPAGCNPRAPGRIRRAAESLGMRVVAQYGLKAHAERVVAA